MASQKVSILWALSIHPIVLHPIISSYRISSSSFSHCELTCTHIAHPPGPSAVHHRRHSLSRRVRLVVRGRAALLVRREIRRLGTRVRANTLSNTTTATTATTATTITTRTELMNLVPTHTHTLKHNSNSDRVDESKQSDIQPEIPNIKITVKI